MNEFTKEELEDIMGALEVCLPDDGSYDVLINKIKSMIYNYCDHELKRFTSFRDICTKCKGIF
jgi:hypothetical protein